MLFPIQGVADTDVADLLTAAQVSRRTFYQHFAGKQALLAEHLRELERNPNRTPLTTLARPGASPRERLAALFDPAARPLRGCPFSNAVSLTPQPTSEPHQVATRFKSAFRQQLVDLAREAGIRDAEPLGKQLSVIYNGGILESAIFNDSEPIETARQLALELFDTQTSQS